MVILYSSIVLGKAGNAGGQQNRANTPGSGAGDRGSGRQKEDGKGADEAP